MTFSRLMHGISGGRCSCLRAAIFLAFVLSTAASCFSQTLPASATTVSATPTPLTLPGTLQLTSMVNQTPVSGAAPTGTVTFYSDATHSLGSSPLKIVPSSQAFTGQLTVTAGSTNAAGLAAVTLAAGAQPVVVSADSASGIIALYQLNSGYTAVITSTYTYGYTLDELRSRRSRSILSQGSDPPYALDAVVSGYFLQPKSSGVQSFLVHSPQAQEYLVFDGSTGDGALNAPQQFSPSGCICSNPDQEAISVDDFDGDGYSDVGVLISEAYGQPGVAGVALNAGGTDPGYFGSGEESPGLMAAPAPSDAVFCPIAITSGQFTSAAVAQLAVLGRSPVSGSCSSIVASDPSAIYLYQLNSGKTGLVQVGTPLVLGDTNASLLASADLNQDGISDLIIGESIPSGESATGGVRTALGNGDGSFKAPAALTVLASPPTAFTVSDFNGDGFPDFAVTQTGAYAVCLTDGAGNVVKTEVSPINPAIAAAPGGIASADFHGDGLADLAVIPGSATVTSTDLTYSFNSASAQAALTVTPTPATLAAGNHNLTATYSGDGNFAKSTSLEFPLVVKQTNPVITWAQPAALEYGVPLTAAQLDATSSVAGSFVYTPAAGAVLAPGQTVVNAAFAPTDSFDYAPGSAVQTVTVNQPSITGISPASVSLGAAATTITVTGQGLVSGAQVSVNGTPLPTTWVSLNQLTAVLPASAAGNPGTGTAGSYTVTVADPNQVAVRGSQIFAVLAAAATAQASVPGSVDAGQQSAITLALSPYPVEVAATFTLSFTPAPPGTVGDTTVGFANGTTTDVVCIPANSSAAIQPVMFQAGTTAGTITVTVQLTNAVLTPNGCTAGTTIIPAAGLAPSSISVPASPPQITSACLTSSGDQITVSIIGFSPTRDLTNAQFQFTAAPGKALKTNDLTVDLSGQATTYYGSAESDGDGSTFVYTQPFTLSTDATDVASVTVTLTNSQGTSPMSTAQSCSAQ